MLPLSVLREEIWCLYVAKAATHLVVYKECSECVFLLVIAAHMEKVHWVLYHCQKNIVIRVASCFAGVYMSVSGVARRAAFNYWTYVNKHCGHSFWTLSRVIFSGSQCKCREQLFAYLVRNEAYLFKNASSRLNSQNSSDSSTVLRNDIHSKWMLRNTWAIAATGSAKDTSAKRADRNNMHSHMHRLLYYLKMFDSKRLCAFYDSWKSWPSRYWQVSGSLAINSDWFHRTREV